MYRTSAGKSILVNGGKIIVDALPFVFIENAFLSITAGNPIYSIDIHPDGTRFATGGLGADAGQVVIWSLLPIIDENIEESDSHTSKLCQLDNHLACVNSVRWAANGLTLASGGDDKNIILWKRGVGPATTFGSSGVSKNSENWRCQNILRGHLG